MRTSLLVALSLMGLWGCPATVGGSGAADAGAEGLDASVDSGDSGVPPGPDGGPGPGDAGVTGHPLLGINTLWDNSWYPTIPFANVFRTGRKPCAVNAWDTPVALDADGNAEADFSILLYEGSAMGGFSGAYKLRFRGRADLGGFAVTFSNKQYDSAANVTTADVAVNSTINVGLHFTNTRRLPADTTATGLTELSLMYPGTTYGVDFVTPHFARAVAPFGILRPMQAMNPSNNLATWAERSRPRGPGPYDDTVGLPFEDLVGLANALSKDVWVNVPYFLNGDGQTKLAQLLEYGSDGDLPYTGPVGSTVDAATNPRPAQHAPSTWNPSISAWYPPLKPGLHVYVELSNELWNTAPAYLGNQLRDDAVAEYNASDPHHYGILKGADSNYVRLGRLGRLHKELAERFRQVVGTPAYGDRYRMVLASQISWDDMMRGPMTYLSAVYGGHANTGPAVGAVTTVEDGRANSFGNPAWPVSRYVHYLGGAPYVGGATAANQATELDATVKPWILQLKQYADLYGVKMIAYEGGSEAAAGYSDPGLHQVIFDELKYWYAQDPTAPFVYFGISDNSGYGLSPTIFDTDGGTWPKWGGIYEVAAGLP